ncbi:hypothetical protein [Legionella bononiensis]|uniref:Uncharacterized protein n=1 Tax=Legionella bononiensis TaxID=2793102 RepID=A0ABS1WD78_9GAMM|nr:hypothetical protein [Legionella bononiensis]MBL7481209.1 hypothetical protein [Legionella bononiensis]MBL7527315.1 hypothetical protein [Legionella bononiensis]MBL7562284.1 hypothetical protein [Legionella bononiensis]
MTNPLKYDDINVSSDNKIAKQMVGSTGYEFTEESNFGVLTKKSIDWGVDADKQSPWKIHISIDQNDVGKAWELLAPLLMKYDVPCFKVTNLNRVNSELSAPDLNENERKKAERISNGSQITVYIPADKEKEYIKLMQEVEQKLAEAKINPGISDVSDKKVGNFCSVRASGVPMSDKYPYQNASTNYNPFDDLEDPFVLKKTYAWTETQANLDNAIIKLEELKSKLSLDEQKYQDSKMKWGSLNGAKLEDSPESIIRQGKIQSLSEAVDAFISVKKDMNDYEQTLDVRPGNSVETKFKEFHERIQTASKEKILDKPELGQLHSFTEKFIDIMKKVVSLGFWSHKPEAVQAIIPLSKEQPLSEEETPMYSSPSMGG